MELEDRQKALESMGDANVFEKYLKFVMESPCATPPPPKARGSVRALITFRVNVLVAANGASADLACALKAACVPNTSARIATSDTVGISLPCRWWEPV